MRHQLHPQNLLGVMLGLLDIFGDLYAAALAAASGMDLCLDDHAACAIRKQLLSHIQRLVERIGHLPSRHGNAVFRKDVFCLILVYFHRFSIEKCRNRRLAHARQTALESCIAADSSVYRVLAARAIRPGGLNLDQSALPRIRIHRRAANF
jgi:hypothetical protein